jgi:mono/diheme cytochrome c family protein
MRIVSDPRPFAALLIALLLAACGQGSPSEAGETKDLSLPEPPAEYASLANPLTGDKQAIAAGADLFARNCAACHGDLGRGDGPAGVSLNPAPANLGNPDLNAAMSDGFIYWRIREGGLGPPFNSAMPAWKGLLDENEIWQLAAFIRSLPEK